MIKGKRSRMTDDRFQKLDALGFKWSTTNPSKATAKKESNGIMEATEDARGANSELAVTEKQENVEDSQQVIAAGPAPAPVGDPAPAEIESSETIEI